MQELENILSGPPYQLILRTIQVEQHRLQLATIKNLDQAVDLLCQTLETQYPNQGEKIYHQVFAENLCPYFGQVWPSAMGLAQYIARLPLQGMDILEIGCGLGIPAMIAAQGGAQVVASDFHPDVQALFDFNCHANHLQQFNLKYQSHNWRESTLDKQYSLVMASDVLYEGRHPEEVAHALVRLCRPGGKIILADQGRGQFQRFLALMQSLNFGHELSIEKLQPHSELNHFDAHEIFIAVFS